MNNPFDKAYALVTGGLGFIGSNLARVLVERGAKVTLVDSLLPHHGGNRYNIVGLEPRVDVRITDLRNDSSIRKLVEGKKYLFNLAGQTSHMDSMQDPHTDLEINTAAQISILEACRKYNPEVKIVFTSTRQIYGKPKYFPVDEQHPLQPVDANGINKTAGEWYHMLYHNVYGVRTSILRLTNTYGPRMRVKDARQTFVGVWIRSLLEGESFEVWGGSQKRDFTYVADAIDALLLAATSDAANGLVFNLGGEPVVTLKELADCLIEVNGKGQYVIKEFPEDRKRIDIGDYYADFSRIQQVLGWRPKVKLREGLGHTLAYYRDVLNHYV